MQMMTSANTMQSVRTDDEFAVLGTKPVWQGGVPKTSEGFLPGKVVKLFGDHLDGKLILSLKHKIT